MPQRKHDREREEPFRFAKRKYSSMLFFICSFDYLFTFSIFIRNFSTTAGGAGAVVFFLRRSAVDFYVLVFFSALYRSGSGAKPNLNQFRCGKDGKFSIECTLHKISIKIALCTRCMCVLCAKASLWMGIVCTDAVALMVVSSEWWSNEKYLCFYLYFLQRFFFFLLLLAHSIFLSLLSTLPAKGIYSRSGAYTPFIPCTFIISLSICFSRFAVCVCEYHYFLIMIVISRSCANRR